jgi:hypothetical protein
MCEEIKSQRYGRGGSPCALTEYRALVHYLSAHPLAAPDQFKDYGYSKWLIFEVCAIMGKG